MAKEKTSVYYMQKCKETLHEIYMLGPEQGKAFLVLKKRAAKYLKRAQDLIKEGK